MGYREPATQVIVAHPLGSPPWSVDAGLAARALALDPGEAWMLLAREGVLPLGWLCDPSRAFVHPATRLGARVLREPHDGRPPTLGESVVRSLGAPERRTALGVAGAVGIAAMAAAAIAHRQGRRDVVVGLARVTGAVASGLAAPAPMAAGWTRRTPWTARQAVDLAGSARELKPAEALARALVADLLARRALAPALTVAPPEVWWQTDVIELDWRYPAPEFTHSAWAKAHPGRRCDAALETGATTTLRAWTEAVARAAADERQDGSPRPFTRLREIAQRGVLVVDASARRVVLAVSPRPADPPRP